MAVPLAVFIDTSVFRAAQFNFESRQFAALFAAAPAEKKLILVLPELTDGEVHRQMGSAAIEAVHAVKRARREHSILLRMIELPTSATSEAALETSLRRKLQSAWDEFKGRFETKVLDYSTIDLREIMGWYFHQRAPFGPGDKRKEFPDALAFAIVRNYAAEIGAPVAVISKDHDFLEACEAVAGLCPFTEVSELTNLLLKQEERFAEAEAIVAEMRIRIVQRIKDEFSGLGFEHELDPNGHGYVDNVIVSEVEIEDEDLVIVGLGHRKVDVQFTASLTFDADVEYDDPDSWISGDPGDDVMYLHSCEGRVTDEATIHGTATITLSEDRKSSTLASLAVDEDTVELTAAAPEKDDRDDADRFPDEPGAKG